VFHLIQRLIFLSISWSLIAGTALVAKPAATKVKSITLIDESCIDLQPDRKEFRHLKPITVDLGKGERRFICTETGDGHFDCVAQRTGWKLKMRLLLLNENAIFLGTLPESSTQATVHINRQNKRFHVVSQDSGPNGLSSHACVGDVQVL
jgi:hypothetical protein